jgi:hypothetical protein
MDKIGVTVLYGLLTQTIIVNMCRYESDRAMYKGRYAVSIWKNIIGFMVFALFISGCAGQQKELLAQDYMHMTDNELLTYYYQLSEEIDRCVNQSNRTSVGLGTGFGLGWLGIGLGVSKAIPTCNADEMRQRKIAVRVELQHRGVNP